MRIDPEELARQRVQILAIEVRITRAATVTGTNPEIPVRPELQLAAVVVPTRMRNREDDPPGGRRCAVGTRPAKLRDGHRSVRASGGVVDVEAAARGVVRREGDRQQAPLAAEGHEVPDVQEGRPQRHPSTDDADPARLLDDEDALTIARRGGDVDRRDEAADPDEPRIAGRLRTRPAEPGECSERGDGPEGCDEPRHRHT
jgi:hypothetical protein